MYARRDTCSIALFDAPASVADAASDERASAVASLADTPTSTWWFFSWRCSSFTINVVQPPSVLNASPLFPSARHVAHFIPSPSPPAHVIHS